MTVLFSNICFDIVYYRPGKSNIDADVLSRYPEQTAEIPSESVKVLYLLPQKLYILTATEFPCEPSDQIEYREIRKQQLDDELLDYWVRAVSNKTFLDKAALKTIRCKNLTSEHLLLQFLFRL